MRPPPIRYPLPSLILILVLGGLAWKGEAWTRSWRGAVRARLDRIVYGPPVPTSKDPKSVAGVITRRGLTLRDDIPVFESPNGGPLPPIARRGFVSIYDEWSSRGEGEPPEFYRVGTRVPIGWIRSADLLPWDTRLVVRAPAGRLDLSDVPGGPTRSIVVGGEPIPVVGWSGGAFQVVTWSRDGIWSVPDRKGWLADEALPPSDLGILVAKIELSALLRAAIAVHGPKEASEVRLRAVLGRILENPGWNDSQVEEALDALPGWVIPKSTEVPPTDRLAELNADVERADVRLGDNAFRLVGLEALP